MKNGELKKLFDSVERIEMPLIHARNLFEIAKMSAYVDREFAGFVYGNVEAPVYKTYGLGFTYERSCSGETPTTRTRRAIREMSEKNPEYEFMLYHTHPNGDIRPSKTDLKEAGVGDIEMIARCNSYTKGLIFKQFDGIKNTGLLAYRVCENGKKRFHKGVPIAVDQKF
jgi:proteasome lid subunit RPN8/RPN11